MDAVKKIIKDLTAKAKLESLFRPKSGHKSFIGLLVSTEEYLFTVK